MSFSKRSLYKDSSVRTFYYSVRAIYGKVLVFFFFFLRDVFAPRIRVSLFQFPVSFFILLILLLLPDEGLVGRMHKYFLLLLQLRAPGCFLFATARDDAMLFVGDKGRQNTSSGGINLKDVTSICFLVP